ncbi:ROK family transcriptional regulator [soil metagenome]
MTLEKATHQLTRRSNERLVLRTIYDRCPISRADVARVTGLTRTTVSDVVEGLMSDGLAEEAGMGPSTGGKAPILLHVPGDARHLIGIDVDQDRLSGVIIDLRGHVIERLSRPLAGRGGEAALVALDGLVRSLMAAAQRPLLGVGVGTAGIVESASGVVRWAVGLDWRDVDLGERLAASSGLPVRVMNDSRAAAVAEWTFGRQPRGTSLIVVKIGQGIGAGIIVAGRLHQGDQGAAGEIGHIRVLRDGPACRCGGRGCLEAVASLGGVLQQARQLAPTRPDSLLARGKVTDASVRKAFLAGDSLAREVVLEAAAHIGHAIGAVTAALDIRDIVVVGPMTSFGERWLRVVREEAAHSSLPSVAGRRAIRVGSVGDDGVELGAAAMLMATELGLALAA